MSGVEAQDVLEPRVARALFVDRDPRARARSLVAPRPQRRVVRRSPRARSSRARHVRRRGGDECASSSSVIAVSGETLTETTRWRLERHRVAASARRTAASSSGRRGRAPWPPRTIGRGAAPVRARSGPAPRRRSAAGRQLDDRLEHHAQAVAVPPPMSSSASAARRGAAAIGRPRPLASSSGRTPPRCCS